MKTLEYRIRFITPAFLGNAEQHGQWRTPPFKALLRQWWRVAYAADRNFSINVADMRREEGLLFGHAWLEDDRDERGNKIAARKSAIRMRLNALEQQNAWAMGSQQGITPLSNGLDTSYAWFGLIKRGNGQPDRSAIKPGINESIRTLGLAVPDEYELQLKEVMSLINAFGLLGSRSRGGWGALQIEDTGTLQVKDMLHYTQDISTCLKNDWAMSLTKDTQGLCVWESQNTFDSWDKAMRFIATQRKQVRTALKGAKDDLRAVLGFASSGRMPSPLRWKVMAAQSGKLVVRVFALPHKIPDDNGKNLSLEKLVIAWNTVFRTLDATHGLQRLM